MLLGEPDLGWVAGQNEGGPAAEVGREFCGDLGCEEAGCDLNMGSYPRHSRLLFEQLRQLGWFSSHF